MLEIIRLTLILLVSIMGALNSLAVSNPEHPDLINGISSQAQKNIKTNLQTSIKIPKEQETKNNSTNSKKTVKPEEQVRYLTDQEIESYAKRGFIPSNISNKDMLKIERLSRKNTIEKSWNKPIGKQKGHKNNNQQNNIKFLPQ